MIHNQFNVKVKIVRSDNGIEFVNKKMFNMFSDLGILHQTYCAHTPQQNEIAERKHRRFLNVAKSLMFQGGIPLWFWSDCVLTAVYLINRLPLSILNGKSPFELVYKRKPNLSYSSPNDDRKDSSVEDGRFPHSGNSDTTQGRYQSGRHSATQVDDQNWSEGNFQNSVPSISQSIPTQINDDVQKPIFKRSDRQSKPPVRLTDYVLISKVKYAMNNEIEALYRNNTWTICDLPLGRKPIGCKWIWKIKYKAPGEIERYKSRLVAKGFSQREGFDYDETFSLVLDVNNAFLYGDLVEDVYTTLSDGYNDEDESKVCKLNKSLYDLNQASRQWNGKLTTTLAEHGFEESKFDYYLYTKHHGDKFVVLLAYVNRFVITEMISLEKKSLSCLVSSTKFLIKDLGVLKYFLGIEVFKYDLGLRLSQIKYCLELLHEYGLLAARPIDIPLP
ncbi:ribonuclease H-like domain-containing protein [Tanacetum coccineum]